MAYITLDDDMDFMSKKAELFSVLRSYAAEDYDETQAPYLSALINGAINEVCRELRLTRFTSYEEKEMWLQKVINTYSDVILRIAEYHYDKQGKAGVLSWTESGAQASYECAGTPHSFLTQVIPFAQIV